jgi:fatty-acid desaturase
MFNFPQILWKFQIKNQIDTEVQKIYIYKLERDCSIQKINKNISKILAIQLVAIRHLCTYTVLGIYFFRRFM